MEEHDEIVIFFDEEPHDGSYSAVFASVNLAGRNKAELTQREGSLDAQKADRGVLHTVGEQTRGGGNRLRLSFSALDPNDRDMIKNAIQYD